RAFIVQIDEGEKFRGVLQSIISMAKHLGMHVTAEGIEIESHLNFLQAAECDYIQGYFYSKPLSAEGAALFLETHCL
ncbi:EAL domain-containing protein, partial [Neptunomonas phycophila]